MLLNTDEYKESFGRVVKVISSARSNAAQKASAEMIRMYWLIGNELVASSELGNKYIETLSKDIRAAFPGIRGFSVRSLKYMAKFAREVDSELCSSCCTIPWGHMMLLLDKTEPGKERLWYLNATIENGWSRVVLDHQIDLQLYERQQLAGKVTNAPCPRRRANAPSRRSKTRTCSTSSLPGRATGSMRSSSRWSRTQLLERDASRSQWH